LRILVAGGAGFVGSHLCERLANEGNLVLCVDDFTTGRRENIPDNVELLEHDVIEPLPDLGPFDRIYNLACPAAPLHYRKDPVRTLKCNVYGTANLLDLGGRFLLASTSEIYGDPEIHPQPESYGGRTNPTSPRACYQEGKRAAEALTFATAAADTRIARIFNTYGPRMAEGDGRVVPAFLLQSLRKEPLTVHGAGRQTRSFSYVDDTVDGLIRLMESKVTQPVNIGNPTEITILDLARRIGGEVIHRDAEIDDPQRRCPDITRARTLLQWEPRVRLEEGLEMTRKWFASMLDPELG